MTKDIDAAMMSMPPGWKSRWCNSHMCACMGCANKSGGLTAKGYTYQDWRDWISRNKEDYMNGLSPTKPLIIPHGQEKKMIDSLETKNWKIQMKNARYPMLEVIDENTVRIEGVKYQKVDEINPLPKPPTLFEIIYKWKYDTYDPTCEVLVDMISDWLPEGYNDSHPDITEYSEGWNDCLEKIKENLK